MNMSCEECMIVLKKQQMELDTILAILKIQLFYKERIREKKKVHFFQSVVSL